MAVRKVTGGRSAADVADFLGPHPETVRRWVRAHKTGGDAGLARTPHPGRKPFLTPAQQAEALGWLARRPTEFGSRADLWTAARVARLARDEFGVAYHPGYLRGWLSKRGHTPQKPARRARAAGAGGHRRLARERLPGAPKKVAAERARLVLIDETGLFLNPTLRRSWAPRGETPVVTGGGGHREKVSVIGAASVSPGTRRLGFYFATAPGGYLSADKVVGFLRGLLRHPRGKVVAVWDGGGDHEGPLVREFLRRDKRLRPERLPAYAPDLNPVEAVRSWLKWGRLANFAPEDPADLDDRAVEYLVELKCNQSLLRALWGAVGPAVPHRRSPTTRTTCESVGSGQRRQFGGYGRRGRTASRVPRSTGS